PASAISLLSLHDALPISPWLCVAAFRRLCSEQRAAGEGLARRQPPHPTATYGKGLSGSVIWINLAADGRQGHSSFFNGTFPLPCSVTVRSPSGVSKNTVPVTPYPSACRVSIALAPAPTPAHSNRTGTTTRL